jgi:hypothetical protein
MHTQDMELPCTNCHEPEKHRQVVIERASCRECHHVDYPIACAACHWRQDDLYRGDSHDLGLKDRPDVMAAAEVTCDGCHDVSKPFNLESVAARCAGCHSAGYDEMLKQWTEELTQAQSELAVKLESAQAALEEARRVGRSAEDEARAIEEIAHRAQVLQESGPLHNYDAATEILSTLARKLDEVNARLRPEASPPQASKE